MPEVYDSPREATERAGKIRVKGTPRRVPKSGDYELPPGRRMGDPIVASSKRVPIGATPRVMEEHMARRERFGSAAPRGLREQMMAGPVPSEDTARFGGPERPKIRDVGDGMVEIRGYHATRSPEGFVPDIEGRGPLHIGTQRAALHRMAGVEYGDPVNGLPGAIRSRYAPHGMFEITARAPRDQVFGLQMPVTDDAANSLALIPNDPSAGNNPSLAASPRAREIAKAMREGRAASVGYQNSWEDPGSLSHIIADPSSISRVRRIYDAGSTGVGLMGLLGTAAQFIPGFAERMPRTNWLANGGPLGDVMQGLIERAYAPGGPLDPYRDMRNMAGFNPQTGTVPA